MPCTKPLTGWYSKDINSSRKRSIVFDAKNAYMDRPIQIPCGKCIGCRLEHSRQWAMRCMHEAQTHEENSFITLTYSEENLPEDGGLHVDHFQKFMKRLRKNTNRKIRFYHCGEYGETNFRPHYHACLFGFQFPDLEPFKKENGFNIYTSQMLDKTWKYGYTTVGELTWESAAYVSRYITKKLTGEQGTQEYQSLDQAGELTPIQPPYSTMSRRPGIGAEWWAKYKTDCFPSDTVIFKGKEMQPPKYYEKLLEEENPQQYKKIKFNRVSNVLKRQDTNNQKGISNSQQLMSRQKILKSQLQKRNV